MTTHLSLTMIVKNEAATLVNCLRSVRDLVDEIIVVDTGSSGSEKESRLVVAEERRLMDASESPN